jgi:hypothetical protein
MWSVRSDDLINARRAHVSSSVFIRNYFNPTWIADLKERTFKTVNGIMQRIS